MAMIAMAVPILPGKKDMWKKEVLEKKSQTDDIYPIF